MKESIEFDTSALKTPQELTEHLTVARRELLKSTFVRIAREVAEKYQENNSLKVSIEGERTDFEFIMPRLKEMFRQKNWKIEIFGTFQGDQRDPIPTQTIFYVEPMRMREPV